MAHTKAKGSTKLGRDSESKRLGVKRSDGQAVQTGDIIIRQRGSKYIEGENVKRGGDDTLYATTDGTVKFSSKQKIRYDGLKTRKKVVNVKSAK